MIRKVNGYRADELVGDGLVSRQRYVIPLWVSLIGVGFKGLGRVLAWCLRHAAFTVPAAVLLWLWLTYGWQGLAWTFGVLAVILAGWCLLHRGSFATWVLQPAYGQVRVVVKYRRRWRGAMVGTDLAVSTKAAEFLPVIRFARSTRYCDRLTVRLMHGQTPEQFALAAESLRHVFGAYRCTAKEKRPGVVTLAFYHRDPLTAEVPALPVREDADLGAVELGRTEEATPFRLGILGTHLLIAGASGAGKGSVIWSLIRGLAAYVLAGVVELWVIDPKGGMEMTFGRPLFARFEDTDFEAMAVMLEDAVTDMQARTSRLKGKTRLHVPTADDPLRVIIVDEIASLTAYCPDKKIRDRIKAALSLLLSQGRAPGYLVVAALQDPRKDVLPFRDLFPTRIALRMTESEQVDMVLGDGARDRGALCDRIPRSLPGVAYVRLDDDPDPMHVRLAHVTDADITDTCEKFAPIYGRDLGLAA